jgi:transposase
VVEQRYRAVLEVLSGTPVVEVAERYGVARQTVHRWVARYRDGGIDGLADRSHAPREHPWRISSEIEAMICELRTSHRRWGPRRLVFEMGRRGHPGLSRSTIYRVLVRHQLIEPVPRRRRREQYRRWERPAPMQLWQLDVTASLFLADGRECKIITGVDDHSRFCVIATVVMRATARAVCLAFVTAMRTYEVPAEVLSDNGKQFTGRFGKPRPAEVLFERICRENGITQRLTKPRLPATGEVLSLRVPAELDRLNPAQSPGGHLSTDARPAPEIPRPDQPQRAAGQAVELERVVPPSGNLWLAGQQIWLGPALTGRTIRLWAGLDRVHVLLDGHRIKTLPSRLDNRDLARLAAAGATPAGPPPLPSSSAAAIELERTVNASGSISIGSHVISAGLPLAGQRVTLRLDGPVAHILSGGTWVRTVACPVPPHARSRLRGARAGIAASPQLPGPLQVRRRVSARGAIMIGGQRIQVGLSHAGKTAEITIESDTYQITMEDGVAITAPRTTSRDIKRHKASNYRPARSGSSKPAS